MSSVNPKDPNSHPIAVSIPNSPRSLSPELTATAAAAAPVLVAMALPTPGDKARKMLNEGARYIPTPKPTSNRVLSKSRQNSFTNLTSPRLTKADLELPANTILKLNKANERALAQEQAEAVDAELSQKLAAAADAATGIDATLEAVDVASALLSAAVSTKQSAEDATDAIETSRLTNAARAAVKPEPLSDAARAAAAPGSPPRVSRTGSEALEEILRGSRPSSPTIDDKLTDEDRNFLATLWDDAKDDLGKKKPATSTIPASGSAADDIQPAKNPSDASTIASRIRRACLGLVWSATHYSRSELNTDKKRTVIAAVVTGLVSIISACAFALIFTGKVAVSATIGTTTALVFTGTIAVVSALALGIIIYRHWRIASQSAVPS